VSIDVGEERPPASEGDADEGDTRKMARPWLVGRLIALGRLTPDTRLDLAALPVAVEPITSTAQVPSEDRG
jgi:hypothetical protein